MIGLDTNVLVRYLAQDDPEQSARATELIEGRLSGDEPGFIGCIVLVETVWVLKRSYRVADDKLQAILEQLLTTVELAFDYREEAWRALQLYRNEQVDFADALIALIHQHHGCETTVTFDRKAAAAVPFELLA